jgi:hypothetical protein
MPNSNRAREERALAAEQRIRALQTQPVGKSRLGFSRCGMTLIHYSINLKRFFRTRKRI